MKLRRKIGRGGINHKMNGFGIKIKRIIAANIALILFVSAFSARKYIAAPLAFLSDRLGAAAVIGIMPEAAFSKQPALSANAASARPQEKAAKSDDDGQTSQQQTQTAAEGQTESATLAVPASAETSGKISTETIGYSGASLAIENLHIANHTGLSVDLDAELKTAPDIDFAKTNSPQVLIVHTHATESYYDKPYAAYSDKWAVKSTDNNKNMVSVGNEFADELNKAGIATIHDTTQYDRNEYSGSYERCRVKTKEYLEKYPSICVVIDLHRDSITYDNGTKVRPVATIDGKTAAQIMICTGSNTGLVSGYDNWESNFRFAIKLQQSCEKSYKNLARPLYFVSKKYNHDLCSGSLLIEIGSEANALDEAKYSARLTARALAGVLNGLI